MQQQLINRSEDLLKLKTEGFEMEIKEGFLLVHSVPYVNAKREIAFGTLVSELTLAGEKTTRPETHVTYFIGDHPHYTDGSIIKQMQNSSRTQALAKGVVINHTFSSKPKCGFYDDYYHKISTYITIISSQAKAIDNSVTEKTFAVIESDDPESIFYYTDSNSSRAKIGNVSSKLQNQKIAIVGLGGTGSYILDLVSKTHVKEIHIFDGDIFLQHNAFRSPGAPSLEGLMERPKKVDYFHNIYSKMHRKIYTHDYYINDDNIEKLIEFDCIFLSLDNGKIKEKIVNLLIKHYKVFIDVGIGVQVVNESLSGHVRVTTCSNYKNDHVDKRINFKEGAVNDYVTNIQIAELNSLNATLAVIKWKKLCGFYHDLSDEFNTLYSINDGELFNDDHRA